MTTLAAVQESIAREMYERHERLMRTEYCEGHVPATFEQHAEMWMARALPYAEVAMRALVPFACACARVGEAS